MSETRRPTPAFTALETAMGIVEDEIARSWAAEGLPPALLTGNVWVDVSAGLVWFEITDPDAGTLSWVTPDAPERAAHGEKLNAAGDLDEAEEFGRPE
jgi:hypothetical protein